MFRFVVEDVFTIKGRGVVVTGTITDGRAEVGEPIVILAAGKPPVQSTISYAPLGHSLEARPAPPAGFLVRGVTKEDVPIGTVITDDPEAASRA